MGADVQARKRQRCSRLLVSTGIAAWWILWPCGILATTIGYPGLPSMKGAMGAFELLDAPTRHHAWIAIAGYALVAWLVAYAMSAGLDRLDPDRRGWTAIRWCLGSTSLSLCLVATMGLLALLIHAPWPGSFGPDSNATLIAILVVVGLATVAIPTLLASLAWNVDTLARDRLTRWWIPRWPGWTAVALCLCLNLVAIVLGNLSDVLKGLAGGSGIVPALVVDGLVVWLWWLSACRWIAGRTGSLRAAMSHLNACRRSVAWFWLFGVLLALLILVPILAMAIMRIYILPQYIAWAGAHGNRIPPAWSVMAGMGDVLSNRTWVVVAWPLIVYPNLLIGRLAWMQPWEKSLADLTTPNENTHPPILAREARPT